MKKWFQCLAVVCAFCIFPVQGAQDGSLPLVKQTPQGLYLSAVDAYKLVKTQNKKILFVDVRTPSELEFVGVAEDIDVNIPYMLNDMTAWDEKKHRFKKVPNSNFTLATGDALKRKGLSNQNKIILICRSGTRSASAASLLNKAGYRNVYSVIDGFEGDQAKTGPGKGNRSVNGWKKAKLPWTYKLTKAKMYFDL